MYVPRGDDGKGKRIRNAFESICRRLFKMLRCSWNVFSIQFSSVAQSCPTLYDPMNQSQHARPPCPTPTPRVHPNPCPLSRRCPPTISSSVIPFSSCPQSFPASGSFQMSQLLHQVAKVLEFQLQHQSFQWKKDWSPLGWTGWISLQTKGLSRVFSN